MPTFAELENKVFSVIKGLPSNSIADVPHNKQQQVVTEKVFDACETGFPNKPMKSITLILPPTTTLLQF